FSYELHGFIQCSIHTDLSDDMENNVFSTNIFSRFSLQYELNCGWHLEPELSGRHSCRDIRCSNTGGKCSQRAVCTGVGIRSDDTLPCYRDSFFREERVLNPHLSNLIIVRQSLLFCKFPD